MIKITLPDKTVKDYSPGPTGIQVCTDIGPKLTKDAIAIEINDHIYDLHHEINEDSKIRIISDKHFLFGKNKLLIFSQFEYSFNFPE